VWINIKKKNTMFS